MHPRPGTAAKNHVQNATRSFMFLGVSFWRVHILYGYNPRSSLTIRQADEALTPTCWLRWRMGSRGCASMITFAFSTTFSVLACLVVPVDPSHRLSTVPSLMNFSVKLKIELRAGAVFVLKWLRKCLWVCITDLVAR